MATLLALIHDGIFREYSHFFHTGLVPIYCGAVLSCSPCGDAWSVDSLIRKNRVRADRTVLLSWTRYAVWIVVAGAYVCAGLSKLRNGGPWWWDGDNLKRLILASGVHPDHFQLGLTGWLATLPIFWFSALGIVGLVVELSYGLVLVSRRARVVLPLAAIGLHLAIFVSEGIPCFDLVAIQAVFINWRGRAGGKQPCAEGPPQALPGSADSDQRVSRQHAQGLILSAFLICGIAACWIGRGRWYPLTAADVQRLFAGQRH